MFDEMKKTVLWHAKQAYKEKLFAGTSGNLSVYDREADVMAITPSSLHYGLMQEEDIVIMRLDGTIVEGSRKPSSEWQMHQVIYQNKPEVRAVVHTHSPYATSFAVNHKEIPVILVEMMLFLAGRVRVADFAINGTKEVGDAVVKALYNRKACTMANHGAVAVGESLEKAYLSAIYLEDVAKIYCLTPDKSAIHVIPEDIVDKMREKYHLQKD